VNLFWSLERMRNVLRLNPSDSSNLLFEKLVAEAVAIHHEDRAMCDAIGTAGAALVPDGANILTHCNTGALATGGIGTAFGILYTAHRSGKKIRVFADETRPLLQGARLTMWELQKAGIPSVLITDNAAAWTIKTKKIGLIITGADRIAANGDSANKIGTYNLAILAKQHGIPFYIAAPSSTVDPAIASGDHIRIEERGAEEVVNGFGRRTAPDNAAVFSPAFDVTPNELITAIITETGIHTAPFDRMVKR
jgi:methylthioribose-1-phosphate isomerase